MRNILQALSIAGAALLATAGCGDDSASSSGSNNGSALSGRYVAELEGMGMNMELDFSSDGNAVLTMIEGGNRYEGMECTYQSGEARIAVSCFGSSGISLTRLEGGDLEGDLDGMIVRFRKS